MTKQEHKREPKASYERLLTDHMHEIRMPLQHIVRETYDDKAKKPAKPATKKSDLSSLSLTFLKSFSNFFKDR